MTNTAFPPRRLCSFDAAKSEVVKAGPMARAIDEDVWARPLMVPSVFFVGAEAVINIRRVPVLR
jgi:hypothetical protein